MAKRGFGGLKASLRRLSGANLLRKGQGNQSLGMMVAVGSSFAPLPGIGTVAVGAAGAAIAVYGAVQTYKGDKMLASANRAARIEKMRSSRAGVAKGAAARSGKAVRSGNVTGSRRVASAAPTGGNGSVKGYYRVQAGKSVFVQGYQRV